MKKLQAEKRLDLLVDAELKSEYNSLELEEMVQVNDFMKFICFTRPMFSNTTKITRNHHYNIVAPQ